MRLNAKILGKFQTGVVMILINGWIRDRPPSSEVLEEPVPAVLPCNRRFDEFRAGIDTFGE